MRLHLIRHPRPVIAPGVCYGRTDLAVGLDEVNRITASLIGHLPHPSLIFSSPSQRCTVLADALAFAGGYATPRRDPNLMEMYFGAWEMQRWEAIDRNDIDAWADDVAHYRPGGGESVCEVAGRVLNFCASMQEIACVDAIVVCHAGTIRLLQAWHANIDATNLAIAAAGKPHAVGYGHITTIEIL